MVAMPVACAMPPTDALTELRHVSPVDVNVSFCRAWKTDWLTSCVVCA
jgi:metal-sulfur cluster biosynthetic enzyme